MWNPFSRSLIGKKAPALLGAVWFNEQVLPPSARGRIKQGQPLKFRRDFPGQVVLLDFWDYSCIHCLNALPYLRAWWQRYQQYNFLIIGVHTPEFVFAADPDKVRSAVLRFNLSYPVVSDPEYQIWERYHNNSWPRQLLVDSRGVIRYDQQGAGNYQKTESTIQALLKAQQPAVTFAEPLAPLRDVDHPSAVCKPVTPDVYLGWRQGRTVSPPGQRPEESAWHTAPASIPLHQWALGGKWQQQAEEVVPGGLGSHIQLHYLANDVFAVLRPFDALTTVLEIQRDGQPLTSDIIGPDVQLQDGKSIVTVNEDRLYRLVADKEHGEHQLTLAPLTGQPAIHTFTFGSSCV